MRCCSSIVSNALDTLKSKKLLQRAKGLKLFKKFNNQTLDGAMLGDLVILFAVTVSV
jgi:hypothetical protein